METQCSSRDEAERRRRSKLRAEDEKMHSLAQQGRQSLIIVSDPLAPSDYTGRKLSPGVSSGGFSDAPGSPPPPRAPLLKRLSRRMSDSLAHITQHAEPHSEFFDLDDSYIDARTVEHEAVLRVHYPARSSPWAALDPSAPWRTWWDAWMLALVVYVMFVTPFELAFVNKVPLDGGLFVANCVADLSFLGDLVLQFHTGYYDTWRREWVTSRRRIAAHYASCYLWLDVVSLLPYEYLYRKSSGLAILRLVRLVRLAKLLRVAKAPRILANIPLFAEMSFKAHVVAKYLGCLVGMLHLQACSIRLAHDFHRGGGENAGTNSYLVWKALTFRHTSWPSNWASYVDSLDWAVQTMLGQSAYMTTAEGVLSIASTRAGNACDVPNVKGSSLGRAPLVLADAWTSDHLLERSRRVHAFFAERARAERFSDVASLGSRPGVEPRGHHVRRVPLRRPHEHLVQPGPGVERVQAHGGQHEQVRERQQLPAARARPAPGLP